MRLELLEGVREVEEVGERLSIMSLVRWFMSLVTWSMHLLNLSLQQPWDRSQRKKSQAQSAGMWRGLSQFYSAPSLTCTDRLSTRERKEVLLETGSSTVQVL